MILEALLFVWWTGFVAALTWNESQDTHLAETQHVTNFFVAITWPITVPYSIIHYAGR
jgi:hypothetical protein